MSPKPTDLTRRDALQTMAGTAGAAGLSGLASADPTDEVEVNVGFDGALGRQAANDVATTVVREFDFDAATMRMTRESARRLKQNPNVRYVEENGTMRALGQPAPLGPAQLDENTVPYGISQIDADDAINAGITGSGVDLAVIDTGIDATHDDLEPILGQGAYAVACQGSCSTGWDDDNGHGTHCAGTAAATNTQNVLGVAPGVTLHAIKVLGARGGGSYSDIAAGIEYVANQGWDIGSLSLGGGFSSAVQDACEFATNNGVLLVAAAGNSGPCSNCVGYPAALDECVAVSAVDSNENPARFTSTGPQVELTAPGVNTFSTYPPNTTETLSGTSMACPHVSGVGALLISQGYSPSGARTRMQNTATDLGLSPDVQGFGQVDAANALNL